MQCLYFCRHDFRGLRLTLKSWKLVYTLLHYFRPDVFLFFTITAKWRSILLNYSCDFEAVHNLLWSSTECENAVFPVSNFPKFCRRNQLNFHLGTFNNAIFSLILSTTVFVEILSEQWKKQTKKKSFGFWASKNAL